MSEFKNEPPYRPPWWDPFEYKWKSRVGMTPEEVSMRPRTPSVNLPWRGGSSIEATLGGGYTLRRLEELEQSGQFLSHDQGFEALELLERPKTQAKRPRKPTSDSSK